MPTIESVFEFLFKFRPSVFEAGHVSIATGRIAPFVIAGLGLALGLSLWSYQRLASRAKLGRVDLAVLVGLRVLALCLLGVSLLEPILRVMTVAKQQSFVGILLDDSQSQTIKDDDGRARAEFMRERLLSTEGDIRRALEDKFKVRFFRFSESAERLPGDGRLDLAGSRTNLATALRRAREELADVPVSGLVLVSDGADNVAGALSETLLDLRNRQLPVFTVGVGVERFSKDVEITRVEVPASVLQGSSVVASLAIKAAGAGRAPLKLTVEDSGRILSALDVEVSSAESSTVRVAIRADEPGPRDRKSVV